MATVPTLRGPVEINELGITMMHEGLCFPKEPALQAQGMDYQVRLLKRAVEVGIHTLAEACPWPNVAQMVEANRQVPQIHVILSTGTFLEQAAPPHVRSLDEAAMAERMRRHIVTGFEGFEGQVKAGMIRLGSINQNLSDWEKRSFRAAAKVQRETGVPIGVHSCVGAQAQMQYLKECGADLSKVIFAHVEAKFGWEGRTREQEADYLTAVLQEGAYLLHNNFGFDFDTPFEDLVYLLNEWEKRGFSGQIFISVDVNWEFDKDGVIWHEAQKQHPHTGKRDYAYMITDAIPSLMKAGVTFPRIVRYLVQNPRKIFAPR
ncbi:MAG: hypothetical protein IT443_04690 [Phycisphaeraceae bacterium]|nr:hypothetical protein [Phycisphaeraceae bacterium]